MYIVREYYQYGYVCNGKTVWSLLGVERFDTLDGALNFTKQKRMNGIMHYGAVYRKSGHAWELVVDERERWADLQEKNK